MFQTLDSASVRGWGGGGVTREAGKGVMRGREYASLDLMRRVHPFGTLFNFFIFPESLRFGLKRYEINITYSSD